MANFNQIIDSSTPVLVDFYADWCAPCRMVTPVLQNIKSSLGDKVKIIKINVDNNREIASYYGVRSIPTLMIFKNGQIHWSGAGTRPEQELKNELFKILN
jgi:thioredoxin 1